MWRGLLIEGLLKVSSVKICIIDRFVCIYDYNCLKLFLRNLCKVWNKVFRGVSHCSTPFSTTNSTFFQFKAHWRKYRNSSSNHQPSNHQGNIQLTVNEIVKSVRVKLRTTWLCHAVIWVEVCMTSRYFSADHNHVTVNGVDKVSVFSIEWLLQCSGWEETCVGKASFFYLVLPVFCDLPGPAGSSPVIL